MTAAGRPGPRLSRRQLLRLTALGAVAACGRGGAEPAASPAPSRPPPSPTARPRGSAQTSPTIPPTAPAPTLTPTPPPEPTPTVTPTAPDAPADYVPVDGDVLPEVKQVAGRVAQALTTYEPEQTAADALAAALEHAVDDIDAEALAAEAAVLHEAGVRSLGDVDYAQLGGLAPDEWRPRRASVMVVCRQRLLDGDGGRSVRRTLDIRLRHSGGRWRFEALASAGGEEAKRPSELPATAVAVLDHPHIDLPDSARWDIHRGAIDERLLETMVLLARQFPFAVTCLRSGHPVNVFGADHVSNHTKGRAVDIWSVGARPVVLQRDEDDSPAAALTQAAFDDDRVTELGSPWDLDGPPPPPTRSFTNRVHTDHLHVALEIVPDADAPEPGTGD